MTAPTTMAVNSVGDTMLTDPTDAATDATNGNVFANTGATMIRFNNTSGSSATVTFSPADATVGPENLAVAGEPFTIPAAGIRWIGKRDVPTFGRNCVFKTSVTTLKATIFEP